MQTTGYIQVEMLHFNGLLFLIPKKIKIILIVTDLGTFLFILFFVWTTLKRRIHSVSFLRCQASWQTLPFACISSILPWSSKGNWDCWIQTNL